MSRNRQATQVDSLVINDCDGAKSRAHRFKNVSQQRKEMVSISEPVNLSERPSEEQKWNEMLDR